MDANYERLCIHNPTYTTCTHAHIHMLTLNTHMYTHKYIYTLTLNTHTRH